MNCLLVLVPMLLGANRPLEDLVSLRHVLKQGQADVYIESVTSQTTHKFSSPGQPTLEQHFNFDSTTREERSTLSVAADERSAVMQSRIILVRTSVTGPDAAKFQQMADGMVKDFTVRWKCTDLYGFSGPRADYMAGLNEGFTMSGGVLQANPSILEFSTPEDISFPEQPVKVGASWPVRLTFAPEYKKDLKITATLTGEKDGKYVITLKAHGLEIKSRSKETIANPDGSTLDLVTNETGLFDLDGTALIEKGTGRVVSIEETTKRVDKFDCPRFGTLDITEERKISVQLVIQRPNLRSR